MSTDIEVIETNTDYDNRSDVNIRKNTERLSITNITVGDFRRIIADIDPNYIMLAESHEWAHANKNAEQTFYVTVDHRDEKECVIISPCDERITRTSEEKIKWRNVREGIITAGKYIAISLLVIAMVTAINVGIWAAVKDSAAQDAINEERYQAVVQLIDDGEYEVAFREANAYLAENGMFSVTSPKSYKKTASKFVLIRNEIANKLDIDIKQYVKSRQ